MVKKIVLIGAGGFGREVASIIEVLNSIKPTYELLGFLDDSTEFSEGDSINGYPWLGGTNWILDNKEDVYCNCTIANNEVKSSIQERLAGEGVKFETIIAFGGFIGPYSKIGPGCVLYGNVTISTNCTIGAGVVMNQSVNIGHDVVIDDYVTIMPSTGISGNCKIGAKASIGGHAFVIQGKTIGEGATIAAGSIVFNNVKAGTTVLGNPAKRMRSIE